MCNFSENIPDIKFRSFRNSDIGILEDLWNKLDTLDFGLRRPMHGDLFNSVILSNPYFQRNNLILALDTSVEGVYKKPSSSSMLISGFGPDSNMNAQNDCHTRNTLHSYLNHVDGQLMGFVHFALGTDEKTGTPDPKIGVIAMIMVRNCPQRKLIALELLRHAQYALITQGAQVIYAGSTFPHAPFYFGLYVGCDLPGILNEPRHIREFFIQAGYSPFLDNHIFRINLASFKQATNLRLITLRRNFNLVEQDRPRPQNHAEAVMLAPFNWRCFQLVKKSDKVVYGKAIIRELEGLRSISGELIAGIHHVTVETDHRRQGLGKFLLEETLKKLKTEGYTHAELQIPGYNTGALQFFRSHNFAEIADGTVFEKRVKNDA